jgi:pilus assembly protein Flp/PilA
MTVRTMILALLQDQRGATAIEYGLICAMIVLAMMTGLQMFADSANDMWTNVANVTKQASENPQNN